MPVPQGFIDETTTEKEKLPIVVKPLKVPTGFIDEPIQEAAKTVAPYAGRAAAEIPTFAGAALGGPLGAVLGYGVSSGLRSSNPKVFGKPPEDIADFIGGAGMEGLTQGVAPKLAEGAAKVIANLPLAVSRPFRSFPAVRSKLAENITDQALQRYRFPESMVLETAAENAGQNIEKAGVAGLATNKVGQALLNLRNEYELGSDIAKTQTYKSIADTALSDLTHLRNFKLATGSPKEIEQLALNRLITNGFKESEGKINASSVLNELGGAKKEIYEEAIGPQKLASLKSLMGELQSLQEGHQTSDGLLRWSQGHLLWTVPVTAGALLTGHSTIGKLGLAASGVVLSNKVLARLMSNEATAKLTLAAMRTSANDNKSGFISKAFNSALESAMNPGGAIAQGIRIPIGISSVKEE